MRQIRMLHAMRRGLETGLRRLYSGTKGETSETAKRLPTDCRASSRPYQPWPQRLRVTERPHRGGEPLLMPLPGLFRRAFRDVDRIPGQNAMWTVASPQCRG